MDLLLGIILGAVLVTVVMDHTFDGAIREAKQESYRKGFKAGSNDRARKVADLMEYTLGRIVDGTLTAEDALHTIRSEEDSIQADQLIDETRRHQ